MGNLHNSYPVVSAFLSPIILDNLNHTTLSLDYPKYVANRNNNTVSSKRRNTKQPRTMNPIIMDPTKQQLRTNLDPIMDPAIHPAMLSPMLTELESDPLAGCSKFNDIQIKEEPLELYDMYDPYHGMYSPSCGIKRPRDDTACLEPFDKIFLRDDDGNYDDMPSLDHGV